MIIKRKSRYVLVEASSADTQQLYTRLEAELLRVLGQITYTNASPKVVAQYGGLFVVRVNRGCERDLVLALSLARVGSIGFRTIKTSGTLKTLAVFAKTHAQKSEGNKG